MKRRDFIRLVGGGVRDPSVLSCSVAGSRADAVASGFWLMTGFWPMRMARQIGAPFLRNSLPAALLRAPIFRSIAVASARRLWITVADELVRARPDVVFALATPAAHAVKRATHSIPIVAMADDLVTSGLVGSMAHPEGNVTGVSIFAFQLDLKRLELLHEAVPNAKRIGILADPDQIRRPDALDRAARDLGIEIVLFTARSNEEIIDAIDAMKAKSIDAVNVLASARFSSIQFADPRPPQFARAAFNLSVAAGSRGRLADRLWPSSGWDQPAVWSTGYEAPARRQSGGRTCGTAD